MSAGFLLALGLRSKRLDPHVHAVFWAAERAWSHESWNSRLRCIDGARCTDVATAVAGKEGASGDEVGSESPLRSLESKHRVQPSISS